MSTRLLVFDPRFYSRADAFAQRHPRYAGKDTIATRYHVSNAVVSCGFNEVSEENIDAVFVALEARAETKENYQGECVYPDWEGGVTRGKHSFDKDGYCNICGATKAQP